MCLFQLPTTLYHKQDPKYKSNIDRRIIFNTFTKKTVFIKNVLNTITKQHGTTVDTIHNLYLNKLQNYKKDIQHILMKIPKLKPDSTMSEDEILNMITEHNQGHSRGDTQHAIFLLSIIQKKSISKSKFYPEISEFQKYKNYHYP